MKKIFILILTTVSALILAGCDDMLDRVPKDKLSPETYFKTAKECELFTNEFYLIFPGASSIFYEEADVIVPSVLSDAVQNTRTVPATDGNWDWEDLRNINFFLEHADQCEDAKARARYVGLAKFFRTYFYWLKIRRFGDVPWVDRAMDADDEELYKPRDDRKLVVAHMLEDINYAIDNLSSEKSVFKVTKWTALALKSRVFLFEGTYRKYHGLGDWEECLKESESASSILINTGGYTLYNKGDMPYRDLFVAQDASVLSSEVILAKSCAKATTMLNNSTGCYTSTGGDMPGMLKDIVDSYLMKDGTRFTDKPDFDKMLFSEEVSDRDPRLAQTIRTPGYTRLGETALCPPNLDATMTGYQICKWVCEPSYDTYMNSTNDIIHFRLAEVMLNYAEAKAELGTLTQADLDISINKLRDRVNMPHLSMAEANANPDPYLMSETTGYPNVSGNNKGVILEIRRERTVELMCEGHRYWDIMRWKAGKRFDRTFYGMYVNGVGEYDLDADGVTDFVIYDGTAPAAETGVSYINIQDMTLTDKTKGKIVLHSNIPRNWDEGKDYLFPIPTEDRAITGGIITQNPGWNDGLDI